MILDQSAAADGKTGLRIRWRPDQTGFDAKLGDTDENWRETILIPSIRNLTFSYFGTTEDKAEAAWTSTWESAKQTPEIVKLSVDFPNGDRRFWPELAVKLMLRRR